MTTLKTDNAELSRIRTNEISTVATTLRSGKTRLQKLFIAQQAAIESERTANDPSRTVARDAGKIMRDARISQEFAENLARRERRERQTVELQYINTSKALKKPISIVGARKIENA